MKTISYGKQSIDKEDIKEVVKVLKSDLLTQGPKVSEFEKKLSKTFGSKYCCAVSSGTAALHLSGRALGWKEDDIIITSPNTFIASANAIIYCNAIPEFVDIDKETYTLDCNKLEDKAKLLRKKNINLKAVIAVDYAGHPCDWESLRYLANKYHFQLVNDNCHAMGAKYKNSRNYAIKYADLVTQSYHPVKHITTGEGGAIFSNDKKIDNFLKSLRSHGVTRSKDLEKKYGQWFYQMENLGYNYRITDFQSALGISQLNRLEDFVEKRNKIARIYNSFFKKYKFMKIPSVSKEVYHAYHIYPLQVNFSKTRLKKSVLFNRLKKRNIILQVHYIPIHLQPYYKKNFIIDKKTLNNSLEFYRNECSLPIFPDLKLRTVEKICDAIISQIETH